MTFGAVFPRVLRPPFGPGLAVAAGGVDWSTWFDHFWQAKGVASQAASYLDLVGAADLTAGVAPTWASGTGWTFSAASSQYLITGYSVTDANHTILARYSGVMGDSRGLFGSYTGGDACLVEIQATTGRMDVYNGDEYPVGYFNVTPALAAGVYGFAGKTVYRDGISDGTIPSGTITAAQPILIGAIYALGRYFDGNIIAMGIKAATLSSDDVAAAYAAMAAL